MVDVRSPTSRCLSNGVSGSYFDSYQPPETAIF